MPDGKVQLWVQGDEESVERFLTRLREAMEGHIEGEDSYEYPDEEMEGFQIVW
jgi:acylphosphatase